MSGISSDSRPTVPRSSTGPIHQQTRPHVTSAQPDPTQEYPPVPQHQPGFFGQQAASTARVSIGHSLGRAFAGLSGAEEVPVGYDSETGELITEPSRFGSRALGSAALFGLAGAAWNYRSKVIRRAGLPSLAGPMMPLMTIITVTTGFLGVINLSN
ncbi:hypothetical protein K493DRAFT_317904 [Basidiobolus meristosporus CBS 931.73]|uniref:Uncharacterized protein n=1 Tax=Basidiobolus meristosporus CBS 931.73 TaxID=1314790 RepID=A0A1Y1XXP2_9FUNG|nr:hypothetical protein K493DRAFT_317904 [Basidiobolus meristosporus CBS 931.73]|eukprot:ORX90520.1 hypothetical protein K493DRAFT_317904 [Basidiobolus meristosporus CBS 931.73]